MDMTNAVSLPSSQDRVWDALNDPAILQQCIAGCESIVPTAEHAYSVTMTVAVGPVKAKFKGNLKLADIDAPNAYTLAFDGQGGVAGFGKGTARVTLAPEGTGTLLSYTVHAQVGGRIAQLGSRLIDGASKKMADDFFEAFRAAIAPPAVEAEATESAVPAAAEAGAAAPLAVPPRTGGAGRDWGWWLLAAAVAAAAAWYLLGRH